MGRSQRPGSQLQRPKQAVKSLTDRYLPAPEQASSTVLGEHPARARGSSIKPRPRLQMGRPTRAAPPRRQERLLRPWPPSLPREAGGAVGGKGLCGLGGGGRYLFARLLPSRRLLPSFSRARRHRVAPTAACVQAGEREYTSLPLHKNSAVIHGEVCANTPPSG